MSNYPRIQRINSLVHRFAPLLLILFAAGYYGMYYRSSLNLGGEGGTVAVIAQRIIAGQRPIVDVFLGYNLMWFYPVVWLFQIFGPNYIALRIFFFVLCTITGLLGYRVVWRVTALPLYALLIGGLLIFAPGMIFRNYMALIGLLNILTLLEAYILPQRKLRFRLLWIMGAGIALSLTFLTRVEVGFFFLILHAALILIFPIGPLNRLRSRLMVSGFAIIATVFFFYLFHIPVYLDAQKRGFGYNFAAQYAEIPHMLTDYLKVYVAPKKNAPLPTPTIPSVAPLEEQPATATAAGPAASDPGTSPRPMLRDILKVSFPTNLLVLGIYLPVLLVVLIISSTAAGFFYSLFKRDAKIRMCALAAATATGCALTFFPQYYFFRPDIPHLAEFMSPFIVALAICAFYVSGLFLGAKYLSLRILLACFLLLAVLDVVAYVYYADKKPAAGTSAARRFRNIEFRGENGVHVWLQKEEAAEVQGIYDTIMAHSGPNDYVICYPYSPTVNFMTNRRSYLHNLYVDNATSKSGFHDLVVKQVTEYQPAILLIDNRAINKSDSSRFSSWAAETYQFIRQNYKLVGTFGANEIYARPNKDSPTP
ncbi:MAG: hypothetical protein ABIP97_04220 [Chthoniobacterales bacterium]